jgi:hypothetical protein
MTSGVRQSLLVGGIALGLNIIGPMMGGFVFAHANAVSPGEGAAVGAAAIDIIWFLCGVAILCEAFAQIVRRSGWSRPICGLALGILCVPVIFPIGPLLLAATMLSATPPSLKATYIGSVVTSIGIRALLLLFISVVGVLLVPRLRRKKPRPLAESARILIAILVFYLTVFGIAIII